LVEVLALKVALAATSADLEPLPAASEALTPVEVSLRLNGSLGVGHLPGLSPGVGASVGWSFAGVRLELGAAYAPARAARYPTYPEAGVDVQLLSGTARTCLALAVLEVAVLTCGGIELGWMRAAGVATQQPMHSDHWIASVSFGPALRLRVTPAIGLWLELDAALAFVRPPGFYLRERATGAPLPEVYRSDFAAARLLAGIEMQLR
jgi:hypothetical protein